MKGIPGIPEAQARRILDLFKGYPASTEIILFGSRAKGTHREGSDIDLAVRAPSLTIEQRNRTLLAYDALELPWKLDLVVYDLIHEPALREHIDRVGIPLSRGEA